MKVGDVVKDIREEYLNDMGIVIDVDGEYIIVRWLVLTNPPKLIYPYQGDVDKFESTEKIQCLKLIKDDKIIGEMYARLL